MVTKIHVQAKKLKADGYKIVVIGDPNHPEVRNAEPRPGAWCIEDVSTTSPLPRSSRSSAWSRNDVFGRRFTNIVKALSAKYYDVRSTRSAPIRITARTKPRAWRKRSKSWSWAARLGQHLAFASSRSCGARAITSKARTNFSRSGLTASDQAHVGRVHPGWLVDKVEERMEELSRQPV